MLRSGYRPAEWNITFHTTIKLMPDKELKQLQLLFRLTCVVFSIMFACLLLPDLEVGNLIRILLLTGIVISGLIIARFISAEKNFH